MNLQPDPYSNWISVSERLPDISDEYLVVFVENKIHDQLVRVATYDTILHKWLGTCEIISHWMPKPLPPKKQEKR